MASKNKKNNTKTEEIIDEQTAFNEDSIDILCSDDTIVENIDAEDGE